MININFKSNTNFSNDKDVVLMENYQVLKKEGRIVKFHVPANPIIDTWNGENLVVQKTIWDGYFIEFTIDETQINMLSVIEACNDVFITDTENNQKIVVDVTNNEYFNFDIQNLIGQTSNFKVRLYFRANKKIINNQIPKTTLHYIKIGTEYFYTDLMPIFKTKEPEITSYKNVNGVDEVTSSLNKDILSFCFFLNSDDTKNLVDLLSTSDISEITLFKDSEIPILENVKINPESSGRDLFKCVADCVINSKIYY